MKNIHQNYVLCALYPCPHLPPPRRPPTRGQNKQTVESSESQPTTVHQATMIQQVESRKSFHKKKHQKKSKVHDGKSGNSPSSLKKTP